jgi:[ribosomal protein S5]-alanine N-acetyltransferase
MRVPVIETERLTLRTYVRDDMETIFRMITDPDVRRFFPDRSHKREDILASLPARMEFWKQNGFGQFGVCERSSGNLFGYCGLKPLDDTEEIEIYYGFLRDAWGRGYATESATAVLRFGFEEAGLERIAGCTHPENFASQKVLQNIGLVRAGETFHYDMDLFYFAVEKSSYRAPAAAEFSLTWQEIDG